MNRVFALSLIGLLTCAACNDTQESASVAETVKAKEPAPFTSGHFGGALPCADCQNHRLNAMLWSTGSALVRDEKVETASGTTLKHTWGRWKQEGDMITITNDGNEVYTFQIKDSETIVWQGDTGSDQPGANDLGRRQGTLVPGVEVDLVGTYYAPDNPKVSHVRECASGKDFLVRLDPAAADIQSRFEEQNINVREGIPAQVSGRLQTVQLVDKETGTDQILLTIKSWSGFMPDQKCSGK